MDVRDRADVDADLLPEFPPRRRLEGGLTARRLLDFAARERERPGRVGLVGPPLDEQVLPDPDEGAVDVCHGAVCVHRALTRRSAG